MNSGKHIDLNIIISIHKYIYICIFIYMYIYINYIIIRTYTRYNGFSEPWGDPKVPSIPRPSHPFLKWDFWGGGK